MNISIAVSITITTSTTIIRGPPIGSPPPRHTNVYLSLYIYIYVYVYVYIYIYTHMFISLYKNLPGGRAAPRAPAPCNAQASLSGTDRTPSEKNIHHVPKIQLYDLNNNGYFNHVWVHIRYMYLLFPNLLRSGTDKLALDARAAFWHRPGAEPPAEVARSVRGNRLSNTTCLTHVFFKNGE